MKVFYWVTEGRDEHGRIEIRSQSPGVVGSDHVGWIHDTEEGAQAFVDELNGVILKEDRE
jgi:hypothetical protein